MNGLALCAGHGGLELGLKLALGGGYRTVGYVEREAYAAAALVARMEDEALDRAPVWDDIKTFDGGPWRGLVDIVSGGYPCQPFSVAGRMRGADDPRHLWPDVRRIVGEVRPGLCFFENVANHLRLGFREVRGDLRSLGYEVESGIFSAQEVGAPHLRKRLFILAYRESEHGGGLSKREVTTDTVFSEHGGDLAYREDADGWCQQQAQGARERRGGPSGSREELAYAPGESKRQPDHEAGTEPQRRDAWEVSSGGGGGGGGVAGPDEHGRIQAERGEAESIGPFPPGPRDQGAWSEVLSRNAWVAPALPSAVELTRMATEAGADAEPEFRRVANGLAYRVDRLRGCGNGVHPLVAAKAVCCLVARARARSREGE